MKLTKEHLQSYEKEFPKKLGKKLSHLIFIQFFNINEELAKYSSS